MLCTEGFCDRSRAAVAGEVWDLGIWEPWMHHGRWRSRLDVVVVEGRVILFEIVGSMHE